MVYRSQILRPRLLREQGITREIDLVRAEIENHEGKSKERTDNSTKAAVINAIKQPVAAAPLLAVILVLIGIKIPTAWDPCFQLIAKANSGVAVLAAGLALSTVKFSITKEVIVEYILSFALDSSDHCIGGLLCVGWVQILKKSRCYVWRRPCPCIFWNYNLQSLQYLC